MAKEYRRGYISAVRMMNRAKGKNEDLQAKSRVTPEDRSKRYSAEFRKAGPTINDMLQKIKEKRLLKEAVLG